MHLALYLFERFFKPALTLLLVVAVDALADGNTRSVWLAGITMSSLLVASCGPSIDPLIVRREAERSSTIDHIPTGGVTKLIAIRVLSVGFACVGVGIVGGVATESLAIALALASTSIVGGVLIFLGSPSVKVSTRVRAALLMVSSAFIALAALAGWGWWSGRSALQLAAIPVAICTSGWLGVGLLKKTAGSVIERASSSVPGWEVVFIVVGSIVGWFALRMDQFALIANQVEPTRLLALRYVDSGWTIASAFVGFLVFSRRRGSKRLDTWAAALFVVLVLASVTVFLFARFDGEDAAWGALVYWLGSANLALSMVLLATLGGFWIAVKNLSVIGISIAALKLLGSSQAGLSVLLHTVGLALGVGFWAAFRNKRLEERL